MLPSSPHDVNDYAQDGAALGEHGALGEVAILRTESLAHALPEPAFLQPPKQDVEPVLTKEGLTPESTGGYTPMTGSPMIRLVSLDHRGETFALGHRSRIDLRKIETGSSRRLLLTLVPALSSTPDQRDTLSAKSIP